MLALQPGLRRCRAICQSSLDFQYLFQSPIHFFLSSSFNSHICKSPSEAKLRITSVPFRFKTATSTPSNQPVKKTPEQKEADERKAAKKQETHIALIQQDNTLLRTTLEDATRLANRRDLQLVKVSDYDRKRDSPVYKLMTRAQFRIEQLDLAKPKSKSGVQKGPYKGTKLMQISFKIGINDLQSKIQKILSWLEKKNEVRISISGTEQKNLAENIYAKIEKEVSSNGRILQKRESGTDIKFLVVPPKTDVKNADKPS